MNKRRKLRDMLEYENVEDDQTGAGNGQSADDWVADLPSDTMAAVLLFKGMMTSDRIATRAIVMKAHIYSVIKNRTTVDRELDQLRLSRQLRMLKIPNDLDDFAVILWSDYEQTVNDAIAASITATSDQPIPRSSSASTTAAASSTSTASTAPTPVPPSTRPTSAAAASPSTRPTSTAAASPSTRPTSTAAASPSTRPTSTAAASPSTTPTSTAAASPSTRPTSTAAASPSTRPISTAAASPSSRAQPPPDKGTLILRHFRDVALPACLDMVVTKDTLGHLLPQAPADPPPNPVRPGPTPTPTPTPSPANHRAVSLTGRATLDEYTGHLLASGFLARDSVRPDTFQFCVPGLGSTLQQVRGGREELLAWLRRRRYREATEKDVLALRLRSSRLGPAFHIRDLLGVGAVAQLKTTSGTVYKVAVHKG